MDALALYRYQLAQSHRILDTVISDLTDEQLHLKVPGSTINPIAAIFMHVLMAEDSFIHATCQSRPSIFEAENWSERLGVPRIGRQTAEWGSQVRIVKYLAREYGWAVYDETEAYLATTPAEALDDMIETRLGTMPRGEALSSFVLWHQMGHVGEMAALKGVQGLKGWPF
jgi:hypothetical protein